VKRKGLSEEERAGVIPEEVSLSLLGSYNEADPQQWSKLMDRLWPAGITTNQINSLPSEDQICIWTNYGQQASPPTK
jgi:hypothetical protein